MRLVVTGGAGSLGSNLIEHVADRCEAIVVLDNFMTGKREALLPLENLSVVEGSVTDEVLVNEIFSEFEPTHVVHSAASYKDPSDWTTDTLVNVLGTINVVKASERLRVQRFINFQTALCYGNPTQIPIPISHPSAPFTSYGISKTAGEAFVMASMTPWVSLRLANVTGPRLSIGPIPTFYKRLTAGEGCSVSTTIRDFLDMSDFLGLMDRVLDSSEVGVFNASSGEGHTIEEVFQVVARYLGKHDAQPTSIHHPGADDVRAVVLDPSETKKTFGWAAQVPFEDMIVKLLSWYDENGVTDIYSHLKVNK